jgi:alcohol dehydrogenase (NADP+)
MPTITPAYGATAADAPLASLAIERREPGPRDIAIDILYCGVCYSDLRATRGRSAEAPWPLVPGHEIVGRVSAVGAEVEGFAVGDLAGVGCLVDSCGHCPSCAEHLEQFCHEGAITTYGGADKVSGGITQGGYSSAIVVDQGFVLRISEEVDLAATAPLLCAGITTYSALRHWEAGEGSRVGVVGLGGLGHVAVKLAKAMGASVTVFTRQAGKADDAKALGADAVVVSSDPEEMKAAAGSLDLILDTVAAQHELDPYLATLDRDGDLVLLGVPTEPHPPHNPFTLLMGRRSIGASAIGGLAETQEMLDFCAEHGIVADVEMISMEEIDIAWERMEAADVRYRFVIDMATMPAAGAAA